MKKLAFVFATVVAVSFASCGNKAAQAEATEEECAEEAVEVVEEACEGCDSTCCDSVAAPEAE